MYHFLYCHYLIMPWGALNIYVTCISNKSLNSCSLTCSLLFLKLFRSVSTFTNQGKGIKDQAVMITLREVVENVSEVGAVTEHKQT